MKLSDISLRVLVSWPDEFEVSNATSKMVTVIREMKETLDITKIEETESIAMIRAKNLEIGVGPIGLSVSTKGKIDERTLNILYELIRHFTTKIIEEFSESTCLIHLTLEYDGDFTKIMDKFVSTKEVKIKDETIKVEGIDLNLSRYECPFGISVENDMAYITLEACVGSKSVCEKALAVPVGSLNLDAKINKARKIVEGML